MSADTIGFGGTHSTISLWAAQRVDTEPEIGQLKPEDFNETLFINGVSHTAVNYGLLTAEPGNPHDGRAGAVSALGNARVYSASGSLFLVLDEYFDIRNIELDLQTTSEFTDAVVYVALGVSVNRLHHCVIHADHRVGGTGEHSGVTIADSDAEVRVYNNNFYGFGGPGVKVNSCALGSVAFYNTIFECNYSGVSNYAGLICLDANCAIKYNALFDNGNKDIYDTTGTLDYNYTSDSTGEAEGVNGVGSLSAANQFTNPTTTWALTDLRNKDGAGLIDKGVSESAILYPDIDIPCNDIEGAPITGVPDIGACELASVVGGGAMFGGNMLKENSKPSIFGGSILKG